jgi:hypothetical protein
MGSVIEPMGRDEMVGVYLPTQRERTLQLLYVMVTTV